MKRLERAAAAAALALLNWTANRVDPARREWVQALRGELESIEGGWLQLGWALGGLRLAFELDGRRHTLGKSPIALGIAVSVCALVVLRVLFPLVFPLGMPVLVVVLAVVGGLVMNRRQGTRPAVRGLSMPAIVPVAAVGIALLFGASAAISAANQPDTQCTTDHPPATDPPTSLVSATDYLALGDYDYDRGACEQAIADYTLAIATDSQFAAAYNNRAYTFMRQQNYAAALPDLDRAIDLRPDYANALMNRGDIYNYYYRIDRHRAIADYDRVIALGQTARTSVCGHRLLAYYDGWSAGVALNLITSGPDGGCEVGRTALTGS